MTSKSHNYDELTLGVTNTLGKRQGVCDIQHKKINPTTKKDISKWEEKHLCMLPEDLQSFYMTCNGLSITWNSKLSHGDGRTHVGRLWINPVEELSRLTVSTGTQNKVSLVDLDLDTDEDSEDNKPHFDHRSRIFELDPCDGYGKVCLVFKNTRTGIMAETADIWYLDRALQWFFITDTFLNYFRLMLMYLGLPHWQTFYTDAGLPPQVQQWYYLYCPLRGPINLHKESPNVEDRSHKATTINADKVFRSKVDKKKTAATMPALTANQTGGKKKLQTTSAQARTLAQATQQRSQSQTSTKSYR